MKQLAGRVAAALGILTLTLLSGCDGFFVYPGSSGSGSGTGNYVYVVNQTAGTLAAFSVGTGTLTQVSGSPYALGFSPKAVVVDGTKYVYVSGYNSAGLGVLYGYSIGTGGVLNVLNNGFALASGYVENSLDVSPDGNWLLGLDANNTTVDEFLITSGTGILSVPAPVIYSNPGTGVITASQLKISPNGQIVFVALGLAGDVEFTFNSSTTSGALSATQNLGLTNASSDNGLAISPSGSYLYIARSPAATGGLAVYSNAASGGTLSAVSGSPFSAGTQPYSVAVNSAGTDVYVASRSDGKIYGYSIGSSGALTALSGSPYASGANVTALTMDKSGSYLLAAANGTASDLWIYSFDSSGNLVSPLSTAATGLGAVALATNH